MKTTWTLLVATLVVAVGTVTFAYSGLYDVSARTSHTGPVAWLLSTTSGAAIRRRATSIDVPDLSAESLVQAGVNDYEAMCADCHGAPGRATTALAQGLNPEAPDLATSAASMSPGELFWVTKNGIKMTGMPAWGATHDDASLWPVVAFLTRLPELDADGYRAYLASAEGMGHHSHDDDDATGGDHHADGTEIDDVPPNEDAAEHHHDDHDHEH